MTWNLGYEMPVFLCWAATNALNGANALYHNRAHPTDSHTTGNLQ
jgi:hypothetical protein